MAKFKVIVEQEVTVELDETKFDEAFMQEFRESFFSFDSLDEHAEHIAQLVARGLVELGWERADFIEGYGHAHEMGIKADASVANIQIVEGQPA
ncbi:hypothetical protein [Sphingobium sp. YC-XJ3]|uniref:hypothetical protein n=1 Tax=Sphingobium sp. YC-XJ3 TaxID=3024245 RepID=UPI00235E1AB6|nr:hypothetical protein [Sphingobium sp. YC-XJ3]WDA37827.1 hypothetical protein PO876_06510 [Sphingobium sp. YC-XJ3]